VELPYKAVRTNIAEALHVIAHLERRQGRRAVTEVLRITDYDPPPIDITSNP
jgi:hypothetical protein